MKCAIAVAALSAVLVSSIVTAREHVLGRAEVGAAAAAAAESRWWDAVAHARAAAQARAPGSPWPEQGSARLEAIAHDAEARGDEAIALAAYGALRTAALSTRVPFSDGGPWRVKADEGLVRVALWARGPDVPAPGDRRDAARSMAAALRETDRPGATGLALLGAGALAVLAGLARVVSAGGVGPRTRGGAAVAALGAVVLAFAFAWAPR